MFSKMLLGCSVVGLTTLISGIYLYYRKPKRTIYQPMYKCIFLNEDGIRGDNISKETVNKLTPIIEFINSTEISLDLCVYIISDPIIINAIIQAKRRKVKVRIITDHDSGVVNNMYARYLFKEGIPIYTKVTDKGVSIMHNKFLIKDNKILLQASLNLTRNTTRGSYDNIMITDDPALVTAFREHFDELVSLFSSNDDN